MAFCNSCGSPLAPGAQACAKCGKSVATGATPAATASPMGPGTIPVAANPPSPQTTSAPAGRGSALKTVLIVAGVILGIVILGLGSLAYIGYRFVQQAHVTRDGDNVTVDTPFVHVETTKDPAEIARTIGVEIYPGAQVLEKGAATAEIAGVRTVAAKFESSDSPDKVCRFYQSKVPRATVTSSSATACKIVLEDGQSVLTIRVESSGDGSRFHIANVNKAAGHGTTTAPAPPVPAPPSPTPPNPGPSH